MLGVAALSCMSPINSMANPVVLVSITTAPQKLSIVISLLPPKVERVKVMSVAGFVATGSIRRCPCLKLVVPTINRADEILVELMTVLLVRTIKILSVLPPEIVKVIAVPKAVKSL